MNDDACISALRAEPESQRQRKRCDFLLRFNVVALTANSVMLGINIGGRESLFDAAFSIAAMLVSLWSLQYTQRQLMNVPRVRGEGDSE